jgi:hypothetical protein
MPTGTERLAASTKKILDTADGIKSSLEHTAQTASILRAHRQTTNPSPEVQAVRDRAAFDCAFAGRAEQERRQIAETQAKANTFFKRGN